MPHLIFLACLTGMILPLVPVSPAMLGHTLTWLLDLACHWQWLFLGGAIFAGLVLSRTDRRWGLLLLLIPLPWATAPAPAPSAKSGNHTLKIAGVNVNLRNRDALPLAHWLAQEQVDIVALFEVSPVYAAELRELEGFPYRKILPEMSPFGIALLSRHPLREVVVGYDDDRIPHVEVGITWDGQPVNIVAFHPMPPISPRYHVDRDRRLATLVEAMVDSAQPSILVGDINATPWSSAFHGLADMGVRRATGLAPTWPAALGGVLGIPIDQVLVTSHWGVLDREIGPDLGSDHLPVVTMLSLVGP